MRAGSRNARNNLTQGPFPTVQYAYAEEIGPEGGVLAGFSGGSIAARSCFLASVAKSEDRASLSNRTATG